MSRNRSSHSKEEDETSEVSSSVRRSGRHREQVQILNIDEGIRSRAGKRKAQEDDDDETLDEEQDKPTRSKSKKKKIREPENTRTLKRLIPIEEEDELRKKLRKKHKKLLELSEPTEADPENGITPQKALSNKLFTENLLELLVFKETHGHMIVPKYNTENPALGRFVAHQRRQYNCNDPRLTDERREKLESIGFVWNAKEDPDFWKIQSMSHEIVSVWEEMFAELMEYKREHGDCHVPKNFPPNQKLARWVSKQRKAYREKRQGKNTSLIDEQEKKLEKAGFCFNTKKAGLLRGTVLRRFAPNWEEYFEKMVEFKAKNGHCRVPRRYKEDPGLASWVMRQRINWRKMKKGEHTFMTEERLQRLKDVGFAFVVLASHVSLADDEADIQGRAKASSRAKRVPKASRDTSKSSRRSRRSRVQASSQEDDEENQSHTSVDDEQDDADVDSKEEATENGSVRDQEGDDDEKDADEEGSMSEHSSSKQDEKNVNKEDDVDDDESVSDNDGDEFVLSQEDGDRRKLSIASVDDIDDDDEELLDSEDEKEETVADDANGDGEGRWYCNVCSKKGFTSFLVAMAHEAKCAGFVPKKKALAF